MRWNAMNEWSERKCNENQNDVHENENKVNMNVMTWTRKQTEMNEWMNEWSELTCNYMNIKLGMQIKLTWTEHGHEQETRCIEHEMSCTINDLKIKLYEMTWN